MTLQKWRRGWDSNSRKPVLSHLIRCYEITVSKALSGITQKSPSWLRRKTRSNPAVLRSKRSAVSFLTGRVLHKFIIQLSVWRKCTTSRAFICRCYDLQGGRFFSFQLPQPRKAFGLGVVQCVADLNAANSASRQGPRT
jgi:hypothetical protein